MASSSSSSTLLLSAIIAVLTISATARPCKTIFFITSSSSSYSLPNPQNPNSNSPRFTFFITEIHQFHRTRSPIFTDHSSHDVVSSFPPTSIRDRTMDIMSIVGALLFGVGCGALTAGTMYLIWSLFSNRRLDFASDSEGDESDYYDDDVSPKKNNNGYYAAIPTVTKEVPPSADEVEAMK